MANFESKITICESIISYDFSDKLHCAIALNTFATMAPIQETYQRLPRNDGMAVYGGTVAASCLCRKWLDNDLQKGQWDIIRQSVLGNSNLSTVGFAHNLDRCVNLNPGTLTVSAKTMATTIQAILGAVHVDGGDAALAQVMASLGLTHALLEVVTYYSILFLIMNATIQLT